MPNNNTEPTKAVIYLRAARSQRETKTAIHLQRRACERRAGELDLTVVGEYVDHGSGNAFEQRPGLQLMLRDLKARSGIRYVITYDHARIARNLHVYTRVVWAIEEAGARLETAYESQAQQQAVEAIQTAMADIASRQHHPVRRGEHNDRPHEERR